MTSCGLRVRFCPPNMKGTPFVLVVYFFLLLTRPAIGAAPDPEATATAQALSVALQHVAKLFSIESPQTFTTRLKLLRGDDLPRELLGKEISVAYQAPDRLRIGGEYED